MTDVDFYTALVACYSYCADKNARRAICGRCPLLHSERPCEYVLKDEIRKRLIIARKERAKGYQQLEFV